MVIFIKTNVQSKEKQKNSNILDLLKTNKQEKCDPSYFSMYFLLLADKRNKSAVFWYKRKDIHIHLQMRHSFLEVLQEEYLNEMKILISTGLI